jgi:hypothetical protein
VQTFMPTPRSCSWTMKFLPVDYIILQAKLTFMHTIKHHYCPKL